MAIYETEVNVKNSQTQLNMCGNCVEYNKNHKIILDNKKRAHGILTKLFRTTEMIEADSEKEK